MDYQARLKLTGDELIAYQSVAGDNARRSLLSQWLESSKNVVSVIRSRFELQAVAVTNKSEEEEPLTRREILRKFGRTSGLQYMQELEAEGSYEEDPRNLPDKCRWRCHVWTGTRMSWGS